MASVVPGLWRVLGDPPRELKGAKVGLVCNAAACGPGFVPAPEALARVLGQGLRVLFSPQHGLFADKQDNMVPTPDSTHPLLGLPVYSLYGPRLEPEEWMLEGLDVVVVDMVDVGCRVYTFFSTLVGLLRVAARVGVQVWILDRPNPLGRAAEGPLLPKDLMSFVGAHTIALRHGLTLGELGRLVVRELGLEVELKVVRVEGWRGEPWWKSGLSWVMPSPNMPCISTAMVYPGQVLLEGTTLSEGRGTTRPFEIFGAPGIDPWKVLQEVEAQALEGAVLRPLGFEPTFHKYAGQLCMGWQVHITHPDRFRPVLMTCAVLGAISRVHPGLWDWRPPPYEFETTRRPIDILLGDPQGADMLLAGASALEVASRWERGLNAWKERAKAVILYP